MKTSYGTARLRNWTYSGTRSKAPFEAKCLRNNVLAGVSWTERFANTYPRFLAKDDLPEPKKPEIHTPTPSFGDVGAAAMAANSRSYSVLIRSVATYSVSSGFFGSG